MALEGNDLIVVQKPDTSLRKTTVAALLAAGGGSGGSITVQDEPPLGPVNGDLWWNSSEDSGRLFIYYDEGPGETAQWVDASPPTAGGGGDVTAGVSKIIAGTGISVDQQTGDVTITNTGGGGGGTVDTLQEVTDAGSTTDNDIEIGDIELNADGSASFKNVTCAYNDTSSAVVDGDGINITNNSGDLAVSLDANGLNLGGTIPSNPAINLSAADGSATFAGDGIFRGLLSITGTGSSNALYVGDLGEARISLDGSASFAGIVYSGGNAFNGANDGARIGPDGTIYCSSSSGTLWNGYTTGSNILTSKINVDGSAEFAGTVKAGNFDLESLPLLPDP